MTGRNFSTELGLPSLTPGGLPEFITGGGDRLEPVAAERERRAQLRHREQSFVDAQGNMSWKFGVDLSQQRLKTIPMFGASGGRYEFNRNRTLTNSNGATTGDGGSEFAQFLLGIYNQTTLREVFIPYYYQWNSAAAFAQNDWKLRPNLTLNLGLRYSLQLPRTEKYDRQGASCPNWPRSFRSRNLPAVRPAGRAGR